MIRYYSIPIVPSPKEKTDLRKRCVENLRNKIPDWERDIYNFILEYLDKRSLTFKTSGSTGKPKEIRFSKKELRASAKQTQQVFGLKGDVRTLLCLPVEYIAGKMMIIRSIENHWSMDGCIPSNIPLTQATSSKYHFMAMVPTQVQATLNHFPDQLNRIEKLIIGGAPISESLEKKLQKVTTEVWETYGMTETLTHVASRRVNGPDRSKYFHFFEGIKGSLDERGCLVIEAPYLKDKVITNDIVKFHGSGEFQLLGRIDNVINSGGVKLHPEMIEKKLSKHIMSRFYLTSIADEKLGEKMVLCIEGPKVDTAELMHLMESKLSKFEVPKAVYFVKQFEETATGKIKRNPPR